MRTQQKPREVTLKFGDRRPFKSTSADVVRAAAPLDHGDGVLTLSEVRKGTPEQQRAVFRALSDDFLDRVNTWYAEPLPKKLLGLFHDPERKAFLEVAALANDVGRMPEVSERVTTGHSVSIGSFDWSRDPNPKD
jgi:hypothetical protein